MKGHLTPSSSSNSSINSAISPGEATLQAIKAGGFKLRPTVTVDKSKPVLKGEGEQLRNVMATERYIDPIAERSTPSTSRATTPMSNIPIVNIQNGVVPPPPPLMNFAGGIPPPPPPMGFAPPPPPMMKAAPLPDFNAKAPIDRGALLGEIKGGLKLRKTETKDKSGPVTKGEFDENAPVYDMSAVSGPRHDSINAEHHHRSSSAAPVRRKTPPKDVVKCGLDDVIEPVPALKKSVRDLASSLFNAPSKSTGNLHEAGYQTLPMKKSTNVVVKLKSPTADVPAVSAAALPTKKEINPIVKPKAPEETLPPVKKPEKVIMKLRNPDDYILPKEKEPEKVYRRQNVPKKLVSQLEEINENIHVTPATPVTKSPKREFVVPAKSVENIAQMVQRRKLMSQESSEIESLLGACEKEMLTNPYEVTTWLDMSEEPPIRAR
jgi:hypothetical protein